LGNDSQITLLRTIEVIRLRKMDIASKNPESFEQNRVKRLSGWDPSEVAWVGVAWGSVSRKFQRGITLFI
jgi:hypothetical protein